MKIQCNLERLNVFSVIVILIGCILIGVLIGTYLAEIFLNNIQILWSLCVVFVSFGIYYLFIKPSDKSDDNNEKLERK